MAEIKKDQSYNEVFEQKRSHLAELVKQYGGIMIGHPSDDDVSILAQFEARIALGQELSEKEQKAANKLAHKFKGSFC